MVVTLTPSHMRLFKLNKKISFIVTEVTLQVFIGHMLDNASLEHFTNTESSTGLWCDRGYEH
jgi:hypothetical protein